ncbi:MAG: Hpt domain-containing protein [Oligoflexales bacterium]
MTNRQKSQEKYRSITVKIWAGVIIISSCLTLLTTSIQVYSEYQADLSELDRRMNQIKYTYLEPIAYSLWSYTEDLIEVNLKGLIELPDIKYVRIIEDDDEVNYELGKKPDDSIKKKTFDLIYAEDQLNYKVGKLEVVASLKRINNKIIDKIIFVLISQFFKTFLASFLILFLINMLVTRHLQSMKNFFDKYNPKSKSKQKLSFYRKVNRKKDDIDYLGDSINSMADNLNDLYENMEQKINERTTQLQEKNRDIQNILNNIHQGIFTVMEGCVVHPEYSSHLESILETKNIAHKDLCSLLFLESDISANEVNKLKLTLMMMIGEKYFYTWSLNKHLLMDRIVKNFKGCRKKTLELSWSAILDRDDVIEKILITVRDVTQIIELQKQTGEQKEEMHILEIILNKGPRYVSNFIETGRGYIQKSISLVSQDKIEMNLVNELFRNIHTIKGNSMTAGFQILAERIHLLEDTCKKLQNDILSLDKTKFLQDLRRIDYILIQYEKIFLEKLGSINNISETLPLPKKFLNIEIDLPENQKKISIELMNQYYKSLALNLESILDPILRNLNKLSKQLDKLNPKVQMIDEENIFFKKKFSNILGDVLNHCLRNSLSHGIGSSRERAELGKSENGLIKVHLYKKNQVYILEIEDDGRGLNLKSLCQKSSIDIDLSETRQHQKIAETIFKSGVSTAMKESGVSGRGVGMDAVKAFLKENDCEIKISFLGPLKGGFRAFKFVIEIPQNQVLDTYLYKENQDERAA